MTSVGTTPALIRPFLLRCVLLLCALFHGIQEYPTQSVLHPRLGDAQGASVCVAIPGRVLSETQLTEMLASIGEPSRGEDAEDAARRRTTGNSVLGLFALTDCLQVRTDAQANGLEVVFNLLYGLSLCEL